MKPASALSPKEQTDVQAHAQAIDNIFGLPPGTLIGIITKLLPILLQLFGGLAGGAAPKP